MDGRRDGRTVDEGEDGVLDSHAGGRMAGHWILCVYRSLSDNLSGPNGDRLVELRTEMTLSLISGFVFSFSYLQMIQAIQVLRFHLLELEKVGSMAEYIPVP